MRNDTCNVAELLSRQAQQAVIDGMTDFAHDEQVMLAQQIIDFINTPRLRIFYGHKSMFNLARGNDAEYIGKAAERQRRSLRAKIRSYGFIAEGSSFALKCNTYIIRHFVPLLRHIRLRVIAAAIPRTAGDRASLR